MNQPSDFQIAEHPPVFKGDYMYYAHNGNLMYGYVRATDKKEAFSLCQLMKREVDAVNG